jgi:hypothetical protein
MKQVNKTFKKAENEIHMQDSLHIQGTEMVILKKIISVRG